MAIRADERRELILDALSGVFREEGMTGVTMAAVAHKAGMSKRTVYEVFDDRAALLLAYLERLCDGLAHPLDEAALDLPLEDRLRLLLAPRPCPTSLDLPLAILRVMIAEAPDRPAVARRFLEEGPRAIQALIRSELDRAVEGGRAVVADTDAAAALLRDMIRHNPVDVLLDPGGVPDQEEIQARFELALQVFLRGVGVEGGSRDPTA